MQGNVKNAHISCTFIKQEAMEFFGTLDVKDQIESQVFTFVSVMSSGLSSTTSPINNALF